MPKASPARFQYRYGNSTASSLSAAQTAPSNLGMILEPLSRLDRTWLLAGGLALAIAYCLLFTINWLHLVAVWSRDASWSHGFAVPLLSGVLVYLQWDEIRGRVVQGSKWGLLLLLYGVATQILYRITGQFHMSNLSMLVVLLGAVLFVLGWDYLRVLWLPIGFLLFMIPPPTTLYVKITTPMQNIAAMLGVHLLPLFGVESIRSGTILWVKTPKKWDSLNIEEACSGIRMLVAFGALAVVLAYSTRRPMWQKLFLALCAAPVAILCNALRVTLTGVLHVYVGPQYAEGSAHEMLGFLMLIPAGLMQLGIAWLLDRIFIEVPDMAPAAGGVA